MKFNLIILTLVFGFIPQGLVGMDSLRMETNNGKKFIVHSVEPKETLFAISKKYNVKLKELINHNKGVENGLAIDQEILVPYFESEKSSEVKFSENNVVHVVKPGDTFYGLSKKYNLDIDSLKKMNQLKSTSLNLGDTLIVGILESGNERAKTITTDTNVDEITNQFENPGEVPGTNHEVVNDGKTHIVQGSESLYSISKKYGVAATDIKKWNKLITDNLNVGQKLVILEKGKPSKEENKQIDIGKKIDEEVIDPKPLKIDTLYVTTDNSRFKERIEKMGNLDKTVEEGFATKIHNTEGTRKYLALHRTAPIGTVIEVKNQMNNQSIFARVVGKLPETGLNKNILIRISYRAYEKLKALDAKIPVEIGYVKTND